MTHDELTLLIIKLSGDDTVNWKFYPALRAVLKLHKPVIVQTMDLVRCIPAQLFRLLRRS